MRYLTHFMGAEMKHLFGELLGATSGLHPSDFCNVQQGSYSSNASLQNSKPSGLNSGMAQHMYYSVDIETMRLNEFLQQCEKITKESKDEIL